mgnify:CR=1 FL=1
MKTVTIVYEVKDLEAFKEVNVFGLEHNGLKSFAVGTGNVMDHAEALESQIWELGATPVQPVEQNH